MYRAYIEPGQQGLGHSASWQKRKRKTCQSSPALTNSKVGWAVLMAGGLLARGAPFRFGCLINSPALGNRALLAPLLLLGHAGEAPLALGDLHSPAPGSIGINGKGLVQSGR